MNIANEQNLRPPFTSNEAREYGRKGGKKRAANYKKRADIRACMEELLKGNTPLTINGKQATGAEALAYTVFKKALNGDLKAWELARDTAGQKPKEKESPQIIVANNLFDVLQDIDTSGIDNIPEIDKENT